MSIKSKLYAGFGLLVLIAVALAVFAITEFNGINTNVVKMNALAENTTRVLQIEHDLEQVRRSALRFTYDHGEAVRVANWRTQATLDPKGLAILASEVGKATEIIASLEAAGGAQSMRARVGQLKVSLNDYAATAESYLKHQQQVHDLYVNKIAPQVKEMQATTAKARAQVAGVFRRRALVDRELDRDHGYDPGDHRGADPAGRRPDRLLPGARGLEPDHGADPEHAGARRGQLRRRASRARAQGRGRQHRQGRR